MHDFSIEGAQLFTQCNLSSHSVNFEVTEELQEEEDDQEIFSPHYET